MARFTRDRLALLVSLVPYLRARDAPVPVEEAAAHFGVEADEVRRAVRLIAVSGSPGELGTYQDLDLFDIDWDALDDHDEIVVTRFVALEDAPAMSGLETAAILAGLQYLRQLPRLASGATIDRLIDKLTPAGGGGAAAIAVDPAPIGESLPVVQRALDSGRRLAFGYASPASGRSTRTVDPIRLESLDDAWYLRAWCLDRRAERTFLVDRMRDARVLEAAVEHHEGAASDDALFTPAGDDPVVELEVDVSALPRVREYLDDRDRLPKPDAAGRARVTVRAGSWGEFARLACGSAGRIRVVSPPEARAAAADWARRGLARGG